MPDNSLLRKIPKVDEVLAYSEINKLMSFYPRGMVLEAVRDTINDVRLLIIEGRIKEGEEHKWLDLSVISQQIDLWLSYNYKSNLRRVINATGVVLHTNLGRSVLSDAAIEAVNEAASGYTNLELELESGKRGSRHAPLQGLLTKITGAQSSLVVNNNAAAVLLALSTLAKGKEVIVSRGQLVEIGGSFRVHEVMEQSGATIKEVGSTNKTHPSDYVNAISENTALILYVHTSNYKIVGFTKETTVQELVKIGLDSGVPVMCDLGSGSLVETERYGLPVEQTVQQTVSTGADLITFSGDKLLGGPQAGILLGNKELLKKIAKNPLARAVRVDKLTVAALEATFKEYLDFTEVSEKIPTLRMLTVDDEKLLSEAKSLCLELTKKISGQATVSFERGMSAVGGGAMPTANLPSWLVAVKPLGLGVDQLALRLRQNNPAVMGIIRDNRLLLDVRTLLQGEKKLLVDSLIAAFKESE